MSNHRQHPYTSQIKRRLFTRRVERALDYLLAAAIGVALAVVLVLQLSK